MNPATTARIALATAALPLVLGIVAVRPADAQTATGYSSFSLSAIAAGVRTAGEVGASGGLVTLDTGSGSVSARLDSSPSAAVLAAPYEPGTLFRTGVGQVNAGAGEQVLDVPDAEAQFPGTQNSGSLETVPPAEGGPVSSQGGSAEASASERAAAGSATGESMTVEGVMESGASTSVVSLAADPDAGTTTSTARTTVSRVLVAGVLEIRDVVAVAEITAKGDAHTAVARLTVGGASVAGQEVAITDDGVTAVGAPVVPGQTLQDMTEQANEALGQAGVTVTTLGVTEQASARDAVADTGGVAIEMTTPDLPGGVAGNRVQVVVGGVVLTATDALALPETSLPPITLPPSTAGGFTPPSTTFVPGAPGIPGAPGLPVDAPATGPVVAAPPSTLVVAGRELSASVVLAAFAVWQFLSLGTATLYAVVDRRRRVTLGQVPA